MSSDLKPMAQTTYVILPEISDKTEKCVPRWESYPRPPCKVSIAPFIPCLVETSVLWRQSLTFQSGRQSERREEGDNRCCRKDKVRKSEQKSADRSRTGQTE